MPRIHWKAASLLLLSTVIGACESSTDVPGTDLPPENDMVAYYPFNGDAKDASGNGHDAVNFGAVPAPDRFGIANHAFAFDGHGQYMITGTTFDFAERTVAFWFNMRASTGTYERVIAQNAHTLQYGAFGLGITVDGMIDARAGGNGSFSPGPTHIDTGKWYHIALVRHDNLEIYYVNGVAVDTSAAGAGGSYSDNPYLVIGATRILDRFFDGSIDDIRIYDRALSADEVAALYHATN